MPEHADLLIRVAQVRDLEVLCLALEGRAAVAAEEAVGGVERVAAVAVSDDVGDRAR